MSSSSSPHSCSFCGQVIKYPTALHTFNESPCRSECGLLANDSNTTTQNDLTALFSTQMSLGSRQPKDEKIPFPIHSPIIYSITQHYHHSSHVVRQSTVSDSMSLQ